MKQIGIRWPDDLVARIDIQVKDLAPHGGSRSDFIRNAVEQMLERMESEEPRAVAQPAPAQEPKPTLRAVAEVPKLSFAACHKQDARHPINAIRNGIKTCLKCGATIQPNKIGWQPPA